MYSFLPDELLKEILTPALQISDIVFSSVSERSPFAKYERSTSAYLLVCKDWLRVATPLLYNVVVLRSKPQIQALAWALKSTPNLGGFIKKLRIECSYSAHLLKVMQAAENLKVLCLSFEIYAQDNVSGICKGFSLIQPQKVILYDPISYRKGRGMNKQIIQFCSSLSRIIPMWTKLISFVLPDLPYFWNKIDASLIKALGRSKRLREVALFGAEKSRILNLAAVPTIKQIIVHAYSRYRFGISGLVVLAKRPELAGITIRIVKGCESDDSLPSRKPLPQSPLPPLSPSTFLSRDWFLDCPDSILENILLYALAIPELQDTHYQDRHSPWHKSFPPGDPRGLPAFRRGLTLVCKRFHEAVIPLYYQCIIFSRDEDISTLARCYRSQPELGCYTKSLFINPGFLLSDGSCNNLAFILSCSPNLRRMVALKTGYRKWYPSSRTLLSWNTVKPLAVKNSAQLADLEVYLPSVCTNLKDSKVLCKFTYLRYLRWHCHVSFSAGPGKIPASALRSLEILECTGESNALAYLLSRMDLPRLHTVYFKLLSVESALPFFQKHGPKLSKLELGFMPKCKVFEMCPNLKRFILKKLALRGELLTATIFGCSQTHPLEEIEFRTRSADSGYFDFLGLLDLSPFKSLRRFQVYQCKWPTTERDIKRSNWVSWAERLTNLYGISMLDYEGKAWIPRLKSRKGRK